MIDEYFTGRTLDSPVQPDVPQLYENTTMPEERSGITGAFIGLAAASIATTSLMYAGLSACGLNPIDAALVTSIVTAARGQLFAIISADDTSKSSLKDSLSSPFSSTSTIPGRPFIFPELLGASIGFNTSRYIDSRKSYFSLE